MANTNEQKFKLSDRETQVLILVAEGHTAKEIAEILTISHKTVEAHRENIKNKANIHSIAGLTKLAISMKLVSAE